MRTRVDPLKSDHLQSSHHLLIAPPPGGPTFFCHIFLGGPVSFGHMSPNGLSFLLSHAFRRFFLSFSLLVGIPKRWSLFEIWGLYSLLTIGDCYSPVYPSWVGSIEALGCVSPEETYLAMISIVTLMMVCMLCLLSCVLICLIWTTKGDLVYSYYMFGWDMWSSQSPPSTSCNSLLIKGYYDPIVIQWLHEKLWGWVAGYGASMCGTWDEQ